MSTPKHPNTAQHSPTQHHQNRLHAHQIDRPCLREKRNQSTHLPPRMSYIGLLRLAVRLTQIPKLPADNNPLKVSYRPCISEEYHLQSKKRKSNSQDNCPPTLRLRDLTCRVLKLFEGFLYLSWCCHTNSGVHRYTAH